MELLLESEAEQGADPVPPKAYLSHVVVAEIEAELPESLVEAEGGTVRTAVRYPAVCWRSAAIIGLAQARVKPRSGQGGG